MPHPNRKRGRRGEGDRKRKLEDEHDDVAPSGESSKRRKSALVDDRDRHPAGHGAGSAGPAFAVDVDFDSHRLRDRDGDGYVDADADADADGLDDEANRLPFEPAFFGVLDEQEQAYFHNVDNVLENDAFADQSERSLFLSNVYKEADGKELKIAQSQSCSRLLERLIRLSTPAQLRRLFQKFSGNFIHLITHRFASHCCEALFLKSASVISDDLLSQKTQNGGDGHHDGGDDGNDDGDGDEPPQGGDEEKVSMENLYLDILAEIEGSVGYLLTDRYASHALRVLLLVLSGQPADTTSMKRLLHSRRKEIDAAAPTDATGAQVLSRTRAVPDSFSQALEQLIAETIAGLDTDKLRALATHPNANPTLQLLLELELEHFGKQRARDEASVIRKLLPDEPITAESGSGVFINAMVHDPVGSHLVEKIVQHAPAKMFKALYRSFFKDKLSSHARSETAGYVVCRVLERLGHDDLVEAHDILVPQVTSLLQRNRAVVVRTLIERCTVREIDTQAIALQVDNTWHGPDGFEVKKLMKFGVDDAAAPSGPVADAKQPAAAAPTPAPVTSTTTATPTINGAIGPRGDSGSVKTHFNLLAQSMLLVPGSLSQLVLNSLVTLDPTTLLNMAKDPIVSRTLQTALTTKNSSMIITRKLIQHFYGHIGEMALDTAASHVVDCIWEGTHGLAFIRERIAEELAENERALRLSSCGRAVWKNWRMDLYKRRRGDWVRQSRKRATNDGFQSFSELDATRERIARDRDGSSKTPLQLARERHARREKKIREKERKIRASYSASAPPASNGDRDGREQRSHEREKRRGQGNDTSTSTMASALGTDGENVAAPPPVASVPNGV